MMRLRHQFYLLFSMLLLVSTAFAEDENTRLSDEVKPFPAVDVPERPRPILELGESFFGTGQIGSGFELPTGAVWRPSLVVWGQFRTAMQYIDDGQEDLVEWASRFDLFSNLYLTATERLLVGIRPLDKSGRFTRFTFEAPDALEEEEGEFEDEFNANISTLFFEGDFGEIFPFLDPYDSYGLDLGFSVGRQAISFQDGMLINDTLDTLGISKINIKYPAAVNHRVTALWAWSELNRNGLGQEISDASLFGLFQEIDFSFSTVEADVVYVKSDSTGSGFSFGLGATQRLGELNTTLRLLGSLADGEELEANREGGVAFLELSLTPTATDNLLYLNAFWAPEDFRSASRDPNVGGALAATGILFEAAGLGRYGAVLDGTAGSNLGGALGYQMFFDNYRRQVVVELGERYAIRESGQRATALGIRLQQALGRRCVIRFDTYLRYSERFSDIFGEDDESFAQGARLEWLLNL